MASLFSRLAGVVTSFFQFGGPTGAGINQNGTALETRNAANSDYAVHRGADPIGDNDFATRQWTETLLFAKPIALQFDGNNALPANSGTDQYYVVTTSGPQASIGQLLWDNGTGVGTVAVIPARIGMTIIPEVAFVGGTVTLNANNMYIWNGSTWFNTTPQTAGAVFEIRMAIGTAAAQSSVTQIPANAIVTYALLDVQTPYSGGTTISIGRTGSASLLMGTGDNTATIAAQYDAAQDTSWGGAALPVLVTVAGAPAAGAGAVIVQFSLPNA